MKDFDLLISSHENWIAGRWSSLRLLDDNDISDHPARANIAVLIATAWLEINSKENVKLYVSLALKWGYPSYLIKQYLVASVYNTLACAKAFQSNGFNPLPTFEKAIDVDNFSTLNKTTLAGLRMREQLSLKEANKCFLYFPFLGNEISTQKKPTAYVNALPDVKVSSKPYQLLVLGMHRSGTSCITNLLRNMGAHFGSKAISTGQNDENPRGFWERRDMRHITDKLLFSINTDWWNVAKFDSDSIPNTVIESAIQDFNHILDDLNQKPVWVLKEPRLCILLPVLRRSLEQPLAVCVYRNPLEVALSLQKRNGFPLAFGLALWEFYTINLLKNTSDLNRIFISYNRLMNDSVLSVQQIHKGLTDLSIPLDMPSQKKIPELVDGSLYRNKMIPEHMNGLLTVNQYNLFNLLESQPISRSTVFPDVNNETLQSFHVTEALNKPQ